MITVKDEDIVYLQEHRCLSENLKQKKCHLFYSYSLTQSKHFYFSCPFTY